MAMADGFASEMVRYLDLQFRSRAMDPAVSNAKTEVQVTGKDGIELENMVVDVVGDLAAV